MSANMIYDGDLTPLNMLATPWAKPRLLEKHKFEPQALTNYETHSKTIHITDNDTEKSHELIPVVKKKVLEAYDAVVNKPPPPMPES